MNELTKPIKIVGCKLKDEKKLMESQSGGAFFAIAEHFIKNGAVVYGCGMDDMLNAVYKRITSVEDLGQIKGSKYVQANVRDVYPQLIQDLDAGKIILFSGTPCYVNAVKNFVMSNKNKDKLYTVDLICHGVPSPKVYREYLCLLEKKKKSKISSFVFRDKIKGWHRSLEKVVYENGDIEYQEGYNKLFYTNLPIRPSCGECRYSSMNRGGDFTVGDYWGVQDVFPELHDDRGVSLLFLNSNRAVETFNKVKADMEYIESDEERAALQPNLKSHTIIPAYRDKFWKDFNKKGIDYCIKHWTHPSIPFRIKRKVKLYLKKCFNMNYDKS